MSDGSLVLVLHSHLPWLLGHGRWPHGSDWLCEAVAESYLPLWRLLHARAAAGRSPAVTLGLTPVLCEQLAHPAFHREFVAWTGRKLAAADDDRATFERTGDPGLAALASRWETLYRGTLEDFMGTHGPNLVARFRRLEERGVIETITSAATHGYLPLLADDRAVAGQIRTAVTAHRRHFGRAPRGCWLPECAYRPAGPWAPPAGSPAPAGARRGLEDLLAAQGIEYFFVDTHLLSGGLPSVAYPDRRAALHRPAAAVPPAEPGVRSPGGPFRVGAAGRVACFGRDPSTAMQVWSGEHGYPGDGDYLEFHRRRFPGGHRYWSVTDRRTDLADKRAYRPGAAAARTTIHAAHFVALLRRTLGGSAGRPGGPPLACAMFDTELFGHWWFEGPRFLAEVLDRCAPGEAVEALGASAALDRHPAGARVDLPEGSWGEGGGHDVWLNEATAWTWPVVHDAELRFGRLVDRAAAVDDGPDRDPLLERLLAQAGREMLLLESSDWPFLITTVAARDYAARRVTGHAADFERLATLAGRRVGGGPVAEADAAFLAACEARDALLPDFDWRGYVQPRGGARADASGGDAVSAGAPRPAPGGPARAARRAPGAGGRDGRRGP